MTPETIKQIAELSVNALLLYLVVRKEAIIDRLLERLEANERRHIDDIIKLCGSGYYVHDSEDRDQ